MQTRENNSHIIGFIIKFLIILGAVLILINFTGFDKLVLRDESLVQNFSTVFKSIILEALPFILLGSFISALIQVFISEEFISRLIPKNRFFGIVVASILGIFIPVCECAIVPIARRLIKKGVPTGIAITFMLAVPIVNPVVLASTYYAFYDRPVMVLVRGGFGLIGAVAIGLIVDWMGNGKSPIKQGQLSSHHHDSHSGHDHFHGHHDHGSRLSEIIEHTSLELYDIGKFLILGAMISAFFQVVVSRGYIMKWGQSTTYSVIAMMLLAYIISLCSEADAFIARTFLGQFTTGSIAAFMILGPMIDLKNTLMLAGSFKRRFVAQLIFIIFSVNFVIGAIVNIIGI